MRRCPKVPGPSLPCVQRLFSDRSQKTQHPAFYCSLPYLRCKTTSLNISPVAGVLLSELSPRVVPRRYPSPGDLGDLLALRVIPPSIPTEPVAEAAVATWWLPVTAPPLSKKLAASEEEEQRHATGIRKSPADDQPIAPDRPGDFQLSGGAITRRMGWHGQRGFGPPQGSTAVDPEPAKNARVLHPRPERRARTATRPPSGRGADASRGPRRSSPRRGPRATTLSLGKREAATVATAHATMSSLAAKRSSPLPSLLGGTVRPMGRWRQVRDETRAGEAEKRARIGGKPVAVTIMAAAATAVAVVAAEAAAAMMKSKI